MAREIDTGKIIYNGDPLNAAGPSISFVGGKNLTTSGRMANAVRVLDNYEGNLGVLDALRREVGGSIDEYDIPNKWYLRFPDWGAPAPIQNIGVGRRGEFSPYVLDIRTFTSLSHGYAGSMLMRMSIENAKKGKMCFSLTKDKERGPKIELNFPDLEGCDMNMWAEDDGSLEYCLFADRDTSSAKFKEAMRIYLSMFYGAGGLRDMTGRKSELYAVLEGSMREKYELENSLTENWDSEPKEVRS